MTRQNRIRTFFNFVAILLASFSADAAEIVMKAKVQTENSLVRLGDIAAVNEGDRAMRAKLEQIELFPAPQTGRTKTVYARHLSQLLRLHGIDMASVRFAGSRATHIQAASKAQAVRQSHDPKSSAALPQIVVAGRQLQRGDVIREADIELRSTNRRPRGIATTADLRDVVGLESFRTFAEGQPIDLRQLRKPLLVKRNEVIRVTARAAGVAVHTTARATEDGAQGDIIVVQTIGSRERFSVHVTGLQQAEVYATAVRASDPSGRRISSRRPTTEKR